MLRLILSDKPNILADADWDMDFGDDVYYTLDTGFAATEAIGISLHLGFYDYDAKYVDGGSTHVIPADINQGLYDEIMRLALLAHQSLGCRGVSRADFRYDGKEIYILEVNTQPGLTPTSLIPEQAAHVNISFNELITWMVDNAKCDA